jgi:D-alanyl-D-alanine carboxypeptidase
VTAAKWRSGKYISVRRISGKKMDQAKLQTHLELLRNKWALPALAGVIYSNEAIVCASCGVTHLGGSPVTNKSRYHIGSNAKAMLATVAARMVDAGKLEWRTSPSEALNIHVHPSYESLTIDHLLTHAGGVPDFSNWDDEQSCKSLFRDFNFETLPAHERRLAFACEILSRPALQQPGKAYLYSNAGYAIAGAMLSAISALTWEDLMRKFLFDPLDLTTAGFGWPNRVSRNEPWGHRLGQPTGPENTYEIPSVIAAAGDVHMSLSDYGKFLHLHLTRTPFLISNTARQHLHADFGLPAETRFARGFGIVTSSNGREFLAHAGSGGTFYIVSALDVQDRIGVALATNSAGEDCSSPLATELKGLLKLVNPSNS